MLKKVTHLLDEYTSQYLAVVDRTSEFKTSIFTSSASDFKNNRLIQKLKNEAPIPGGVGYGVYYKKNAHWGFTDFSCVDFGIFAPKSVGGNSQSYLYLTATNGTKKGVEALISYYGQEASFFKIFDWAKPDAERWSKEIPCAEIPENFTKIVVNKIEHNFCRIANKTEMISPGVWENKVYLFNFIGTNWDLVYKYQYLSTLEDQKDEFLGSWGPIVETFQEGYTNVNPLGFYKIRLYNNKMDNLLQPSNSTLKDDPDGLDLAFRESNHTFYVV